MISLLLALAAVAGQSDKLPPANPLPPPTVTEEGQVMVPINTLFAAIASRDAMAMERVLRPDATATIASEEADGSRHITHSDRAAILSHFRPGPEKFEERLYDPAIEIDGDVAMVWGRYNFYIDGKLHHCGYDHFDMIRENGRWQIQSLTWSSRMTGCDSE